MSHRAAIAAALRRVIEDTDTRAGRVFDLSIQTLIAMSLVAFSLETLPDLSPAFRQKLSVFETFTVFVFLVEYALRVAVARPRRSFVLSAFGLVDLVAIASALLPVAIDLRTLRAVRFLRLIRILKLARYSRAVRRFGRAFSSVRAELSLFLSVCLLIVYLSSVGIYFFEHDAQPDVFRSVFDAMWWSLTTLTTVGYGDAYPVTTGGRLFTSVVLLVGLGLVAVPTGLIASALTTTLREEERDAHPSDELPDHVRFFDR